MVLVNGRHAPVQGMDVMRNDTHCLQTFPQESVEANFSEITSRPAM